MPLIPDCLPNPGWRVLWGGQEDPGAAICNLGVDPDGKVAQHQAGFASTHFTFALPRGGGAGGLPNAFSIQQVRPIPELTSTRLLCVVMSSSCIYRSAWARRGWTHTAC